jgi:hypothetical protein
VELYAVLAYPRPQLKHEGLVEISEELYGLSPFEPLLASAHTAVVEVISGVQWPNQCGGHTIGTSSSHIRHPPIEAL